MSSSGSASKTASLGATTTNGKSANLTASAEQRMFAMQSASTHSATTNNGSNSLDTKQQPVDAMTTIQQQQIESRDMFSSPDVRIINDEMNNEFAQLQSWIVDDLRVSSTAANQQRSLLSSRLFGRARLLSPTRPQAIDDGSACEEIITEENNTAAITTPASTSQPARTESRLKFTRWPDAGTTTTNSATGSSVAIGGERHEFSFGNDKSKSYFELSPSESSSHRFDGEKVKELLNKAQSHTSRHFGASSLGNSLRPSGIDECDYKNDGNNNNSTNKSTTVTTTVARHIISPITSGNRHQAIENNRPLALSHAAPPITTSNSNRDATATNDIKRKKSLTLQIPTDRTTRIAVDASIKRIEQKMSDLCKKMESCNETKQVIEMLKIVIQMIEKAWSVPVCGDDLGFRLCNSLRISGGLDFILGLINEAHESQIGIFTDSFSDDLGEEEEANLISDQGEDAAEKMPKKLVIDRVNKGLKLNLASSARDEHPITTNSNNNDNDINSTGEKQRRQQEAEDSGVEGSREARDSDSETLQGSYLDSNSIASINQSDNHDSEYIIDTKTNEHVPTIKKDNDYIQNKTETEHEQNEVVANDETDLNSREDDPRKEELIFLCARLLSQCLTSDNRDYLVEAGLKPVVKLACHFTTMKSYQTHRQLSSFSIQTRPMLTRQNSSISKSASPTSSSKKQSIASSGTQSASPATVTGFSQQQHQQHQNHHQAHQGANIQNKENKDDIEASKNKEQQDNSDFESDVLATIGTEILQHLFKHSEDVCSTIIALGGLEAILYGCRSSNIEILRHCASALANLALYGGPDSQQTMIEHKAHVWLFPLAFNEDDNIQYYACLAIVILLANKEIESDVLKSSTLDLVEPFVTTHEPRKFAKSSTAHIHGQSAAWLRKLVPLLESKREAARNLAAFHFAMEAYIKKEQGQVSLFKEIGAIEPLKRLGSSPIANSSKFACQALRLIGEKEPHKLSQQVPLWNCDDVIEWIGQLDGFRPYREKFRESGVDGDLLLQLDEQQLEFYIGIQNGIVRRRFLRELNQLKLIADYSSCDKTGLCSLLGRDNIQYAYQMLLYGVTRENICQFDGEQLLSECKVLNIIHRLRLAQTIEQLQERNARDEASEGGNGTDGANQKTLDVFVSYRRSNGSQLASLLKVHLQLRGFSVFIDVERLEAGKFDNNLLDSIQSAKNFILVLSPNALDRCIGDHECKDWVHKEIVAALASECNIIPIMDNFHWPEPEQLPEDMRSISNFNGIRWYHDYQDACVNKIERFIRGELMNTVRPMSQTGGGSIVGGPNGGGGNTTGVNASGGTGSLQRLASGVCSGVSQYAGSTPASSVYSARATPFADLDYHPLSSYCASSSPVTGGNTSGG